jgi:hypothetical protein
MLILAGLILLFLDPLACLAQATGADNAPSPFTCLFDTAAASAAPLLPETLNAKKGWTAVPEETLTHTFAGDAVFMNDRVAVVFRRNAAGAEVYSKLPGGSKQRAALLPLGADGSVGALTSVKIIENSQASVMLEAALTAKSGAIATFRFRLTAGESLLEVRGAQGAGRLRVCDQAQYMVVPDFFADDMVFDPGAHGSNRVGLPAENSVLGLTDEGAAIVACVWPSSRQNVDLLLSPEAQGRRIAGYEIDLPANGRLWIAAMEGPGIWHARRVMDQKASAEVALDWKPPMPARWRADFAAADGLALSTYFADPDAGAEPENAKSNGSCRFDAGRALVRVIDSAAAKSSGLVVVYPVERTRTTPLAAFCLVDIMRNALGVGPCQYVLDAEGLGNSESPTPDQVTHWVEKQFEKKVSKRDVDAIREQLAKMTLQVKRTDARISEYIDFAGKIKQACGDYAKDPALAPAATRLAAIAQHMTAPSAVALPAVEKLAGEVSAQAERDDALAKCQPSLAAMRSAGAGQDYALAKLRMAARRLKQESRTLAVTDPKAAAFAAQIQQQAEQMLVQK